jgi:hypothetical protein
MAANGGKKRTSPLEGQVAVKACSSKTCSFRWRAPSTITACRNGLWRDMSILGQANPCQPRPAILGLCVVPGDAVSKLDWASDGAERLEAFPGTKDRHVAIVEHAPED